MDQFVQDVVNPLLHTLLTALVGAALAVALRYMQKLGLQIDAEQQQRVQEIAKSVVLRVEEQVEDEVRRHGAQFVDKSATKLTEATTALLEKLPNIEHEEAQALAKEAVARVGLGATAAAAKLVKSAQS